MAKRNLNLRQQRRIDHKHQRVEASADEDGETGVVVARYGKQADIRPLINDGAGDTVRCHIRANVQDIVTGDRVNWQRLDSVGVVVAVHPRQSLMSRPDPRGQLRPLAANISQVAVVIAPQPRPHQNLVDRYLAAIEHLGATPLLILNKADLVAAGDSHIGELLALYRSLGYSLIEVSAQRGSGLDRLLAALDGQSTVFVGQSGVGKSSLVNLISPEAGAAVGELSQVDKGKHTTTTARLYSLPSGGELIDSPGIREFGLGHMEPDQVAAGFVEFRPFLGHCKYRNCRHMGEPGCAVGEAADRREVREARLLSYQQIVNDLCRQ